MQSTIVPKEVIWVRKILWIMVIVPTLIVAIMVIFLGSMFGLELVKNLLLKIPAYGFLFVLIWGINHFLLKGNKWVMYFTIALAIYFTIAWVEIVLNITQNTGDTNTLFITSLVILFKILSFCQIALNLSVVFLLIKRRAYFHKSNLNAVQIDNN